MRDTFSASRYGVLWSQETNPRCPVTTGWTKEPTRWTGVLTFKLRQLFPLDINCTGGCVPQSTALNVVDKRQFRTPLLGNQTPTVQSVAVYVTQLSEVTCKIYLRNLRMRNVNTIVIAAVARGFLAKLVTVKQR
jgi:hypothetical protein